MSVWGSVQGMSKHCRQNDTDATLCECAQGIHLVGWSLMSFLLVGFCVFSSGRAPLSLLMSSHPYCRINAASDTEPLFAPSQANHILGTESIQIQGIVFVCLFVFFSKEENKC